MIDFTTQDNADRISRIRAWAETLQAGLGDAALALRMEDKLRKTGYWRGYLAGVTSTMSLEDRGRAALRVVPEWGSV
jgi:hypothetical protein